MDTHKNAPLTPKGREAMVRSVVEGGLSKASAARQFNVTPKTVAKWFGRFRADGLDGLRDRSSRPHSLPGQTPAATCAAVEALRRRRYTGKQIASELGISHATVSRILRRLGLNRLAALEPAEPIRRYEREHPGELIHLDIKKLGRIGSVGHRITGRYPGVVNRHHGIGWEFVHVCIDDASRVAFVQVLADQRKESAVAFLEAAVASFAKLGVRIERVMTDNGSCYQSKMFRAACKRLGLRQVFTRPYTPRTNGKAERFIQTALRESRAYHNSDQRSDELMHWLHRYNWHRPTYQSTRSIQGQPVEAPHLANQRHSYLERASRLHLPIALKPGYLGGPADMPKASPARVPSRPERPQVAEAPHSSPGSAFRPCPPLLYRSSDATRRVEGRHSSRGSASRLCPPLLYHS